MRDIYLRAKGRTVIWRSDMLDLIYHNTPDSLRRDTLMEGARLAVWPEVYPKIRGVVVVVVVVVVTYFTHYY